MAADEAVAASLPAPPAGFSAATPTTAAAARTAGWAVVTDFGAVGDGASRPLSTRYRTLADARAVYPAAAALTDELDGVAIQKATDAGRAGVFYPAGTYLHSAAIVVRDRQSHLGAGPAGQSPTAILHNTRSRANGYDWALAHSFRIGDIHPVAMQTGQSGVSWAVRTLAPITAGATSIRLTQALGTAKLAVGDVVAVRCDNPPFAMAEGVTYDALQWNRVSSYDAATGVIGLELPVPWTIVAASSSTTTLSGPRLCVNAGGDYFLNVPWQIVQQVEIGRLAMVSAGFTARNGVWRGWFHDLAVFSENMIGFNALVLSTIERVTGTWSDRMIEIKMAGHTSTVRTVSGTWKPLPANSVGEPGAAVDIGEQSYDLTLSDITVTISSDDTVDRRALEISCPGVSFSGVLNHAGTGTQQSVWAVKDSQAPANPPTNIALDLVVRTRPGIANYGLVGYPVARTSDPAGVTLALDQRSSGAPAGAAFYVATGRGVVVKRLVGDTTTARWSPPGQAPTGCTSVQVPPP